MNKQSSWILVLVFIIDLLHASMMGYQLFLMLQSVMNDEAWQTF